MNTRERYIAAVLFQPTDRVPYIPGRARKSTIEAWRMQGLPPDVDWYTYVTQEILGINEPWLHAEQNPGVDFRMIPQFEEKVIETKGDSQIVQDWKGNICEISSDFTVDYLRAPIDFVTRKWIKCPVEDWADWEAMKARYDPNDPGRLPDDYEQRCKALREQDRIVGLFFNGPFMQLREWLGFENLCMAFIEKPDMVKDMLKFYEEFVSELLEKVLPDVKPDYVHIAEDMAYKHKTMISPAMTREFILPVWSNWAEIVHGSGCPIFDVDSDGFVGELIPLWIEAGFQINDPIEIAAGNDVVEFRRSFGKQMAYLGAVDKRAMAKGGTAIEHELERLRPTVESGGLIPSCDHGVPPDVSWPNMIRYCQLLAEITGWL